MKEGVLGWILGPPGTGKSVGAFAFAASVDRVEWTIMWVQFSRDGIPSISIFEGDYKYTAPCSLEMLLGLISLRAQTGVKNSLLILDGYLRSEVNHQHVLQQATGWRNMDKDRRRLVVASSLSSRGKFSEGEDIANSVQEHIVPSWIFQEYLAALQIPELAESVYRFLDTTPGKPLQEAIEDKFYYAGGCARYMFEYSSEVVKSRIEDAVRTLPIQLSEAFFMMSWRAGTAINLLVGLLPGKGGWFEFFVSSYAASCIAERVTPPALKSMLSALRDDVSGSGAGSMFETMLCSQLRSGGLPLRFRNGTSVLLSPSSIRKINLKSSSSIEVEDEEWMKPESPINRGYGLVYINRPARFVRFIQSTRSDLHRLNLTPCKEFIDKLTDCEIRIVEFCFVVNYDNLKRFRVLNTENDPVKGRGALGPYQIASDKFEMWQSGSEEMQVTVTSTDDIFI